MYMDLQTQAAYLSYLARLQIANEAWLAEVGVELEVEKPREITTGVWRVMIKYSRDGIHRGTIWGRPNSEKASEMVARAVASGLGLAY